MATTEIVFSDREQKLIRLLARGLTVKQAAEQVGISGGYGERLVEKLRLKLRVNFSREIPAAYMAATGDNPLS
jgi:DNA-binding NarL/FixJ family response regulator